jgi:hypothetical protein
VLSGSDCDDFVPLERGRVIRPSSIELGGLRTRKEKMLVKNLSKMEQHLTAPSPLMSLARVESDRLVLALAQRQDQLEQTQVRFMRFQAAMNAYNIARTHRLALAQKRLEGQIVAGKAALSALSTSLDRESGKVRELETNVANAEEELTQVKRDLNALEVTIKEQSEQLSKQGHEIKRLSVSKGQREALVEAIVLLTALAAVRSSLVNFPISTALMAFPKRSRVTYFTKTMLRLVLFLSLMRRLRTYAVMTGWTSDDASLADYVINLVFSQKPSA